MHAVNGKLCVWFLHRERAQRVREDGKTTRQFKSERTFVLVPSFVAYSGLDLSFFFSSRRQFKLLISRPSLLEIHSQKKV